MIDDATVITPDYLVLPPIRSDHLYSFNCARLVSQFFPTLPSSYDFNQKVIYLHDCLERYCRDQQADGKTILIDQHYTESMSKDAVTTLVDAAVELEFSNGQQRKSTAGYAFQRIIQDLLQACGLNIVSGKHLRSTVDHVLLDDDLNTAALLHSKRTLRERYKVDVTYNDLASTHNVPAFLVTYDNPGEKLLNDMLAFGFDVVMRDEVVEQFSTTPHVHYLSRLPILLQRLSNPAGRLISVD